MIELIKSVYTSLENKNWYAALFTSLAIPDICGKLQFPNDKSQKRYVVWFNNYLSSIYKNFLTAEDCYALRCSYLHEGSDNIENQIARKILNSFMFITGNTHCVYLKINGTKILLLNVSRFCLDICASAEKWMRNIADDEIIQQRIVDMIKIHDGSFGMKL